MKQSLNLRTRALNQWLLEIRVTYNDCLTVLQPPPASHDAHPAQELLLPAPPITIPRHADGDHVRLPENSIIKEKVYQTKV